MVWGFPVAATHVLPRVSAIEASVWGPLSIETTATRKLPVVGVMPAVATLAAEVVEPLSPWTYAISSSSQRKIGRGQRSLAPGRRHHRLHSRESVTPD